MVGVQVVELESDSLDLVPLLFFNFASDSPIY